MKKLVLSAIIAIMAMGSSFAQKYALIDMEYIFWRIPSYEMANEQLNQISKKWQAEVDALAKEAKEMYAKYQSEMVYLSPEMKKTKENEILAKEKEVSDLNRKYFGSEGELYKKRESLLAPIQDEVYNAVKELSEEKGYVLILDRASGVNIVFASPSIDVSEDVLKKMGY